jgi:hypothetical protein
MFERARGKKLALTLVSAVLIIPTKLPASENGAKSSLRALSAKSALQNERLGLFSADAFRVTTGKCNDCPTPKQALWYFQNDVIAVPHGGISAAGLAAGSPGYENVLRGLQELGAQAHLPYPNLIWLGSPEIISGASLSNDGEMLQTHGGERIAFSLVPKISTNRSYYNASSLKFFRQRSLRIRGTAHSQNGIPEFVARTIWPEDFRMRPNNLAREPLRSGESLSQLITNDSGGAKSSFQTRLLWERDR